MTPRALRFYETKGLLTPRRARARRVYDYRDRARLDLTLRGKRLGSSLADIRDYLQLYDVNTSQRGQLQHLQQCVCTRIEDLEKQQDALERTLAELSDIREQTRAAISQNATRPCGSIAAFPQPSLLTIGDDA